MSRLLVDDIAQAIRWHDKDVGAGRMAENIVDMVFDGDGLIIDLVFYPFMVAGERNPALEWQYQWRTDPTSTWSVSRITPVIDHFPNHEYRWVVVVKEETP